MTASQFLALVHSSHPIEFEKIRSNGKGTFYIERLVVTFEFPGDEIDETM